MGNLWRAGLGHLTQSSCGEVATGAELRSIKMGYSYFESVAFSPDGLTLSQALTAIR